MAGPYGTPRTWSAGERPTAAQFNAEFRDWIAALANPPACRVRRTTAQSINTATVTAITFDAERTDTDTMHSTSSNTSRITITTSGRYHVYGNVAYAANATGIRYTAIRLNGTTVVVEDARAPAGAGDATIVSIDTSYLFSAGDYVELVAFQTSGGALNLDVRANATPEFGAEFIGLV